MGAISEDYVLCSEGTKQSPINIEGALLSINSMVGS